MVWNGSSWRYAWLDTGGRVYVEDRTTYRDAGSTAYWVSISWMPAEVHLGLQQEQRLYEAELLFERFTAAGLKAEMAYGYADFSSGNDETWDESAVLAAGRQVSLRPKPRGMSTRLRFSDTEPASMGTGRGLAFIGLSADIAPKQGATRATPRLAASVRR